MWHKVEPAGGARFDTQSQLSGLIDIFGALQRDNHTLALREVLQR